MLELQETLTKVMDAASEFRKIHAEVANERIFTGEYLRKIAARDVLIKDKPENREKVEKLIDIYTSKIIERSQKIKECLTLS